MLVSYRSLLAGTLLAAAVVWLCGSTALAAVSLPGTCDDIETAAAAETPRRNYAGKRHSELMARYEQEGELSTKDLRALRRIRDDIAKRVGRKTAAYAIVSLDLVDIGSANAAFGAAFRQIEPISKSYFGDIAPEALLAAGARIQEIGRELGSARAIYRGKYMRLAGLNRSASPDAAVLAAELLPEAAARIEKSVASDEASEKGACWVEQPAIQEIATALPPTAELARRHPASWAAW